MIGDTFKRFNRKEYFVKKAVKEYLGHYDSKKHSLEELLTNFKRTPIFFVAVHDDRIVGLIRGRPNKISNLFVDFRYHNQGIGKRLVQKFESEARKHTKKINIRASLYATPFYQKMGYKKTTGIRNFRGLKIYPMKKIL